MTRKRLTQGLWILPAMIAILLCVPCFMGILFEHTYRNLISFYNQQGFVKAEIVHYERHWFSSEATVHLIVTDPDFKVLWSSLDLDENNLDLVVKQTIRHGPFFYQPNKKLKYWIGIAALHNKVQVSNDSSLILEDDDLVTILGNYYKNFHTLPFEYETEDDVHFNFSDGIKGFVRIYPSEKRFSGKVYLFNIKIDDGENFISIPNTTIYFNQMKSGTGLWLGEMSLLIPEMEGRDAKSQLFNVMGIDFNGRSFEKSHKVSDIRRLDIDKIEVNQQSFGPVHIALSAKNLDAKAIKDFIDSSRKVLTEGERYESQLQYKMAMMLPSIFKAGASLHVNTFEIKTPVGKITLNGKIEWPVRDLSPPNDIPELWESSDVTGDLQISEVLANKLLKVASELPFFRRISSDERKNLLVLQLNLQLLNQQNFLMLSSFVDHRLMSEEAGLDLLGLQKNDESLQTYSDEVKNLLLRKELTLPASYLLVWKYSQLRMVTDAMDHILMANQEALTRSMQDQVFSWIKAGYIKKDQDDYAITLQKSGESIKLNGKDF